MNTLIRLHDRAFSPLARADWLLPTLARLVFAGVLLVYFWASGVTKLGPGLPGLFDPSMGAYAQIFPRAMAAVSYDISQFGLWHKLVVLAGTWSEFILPLMILVGLMTRLAALGMIGFIVVQTLTDLIGHGGAAHPETLGAWFDRFPDSPIMDQRALWVLVLLVLVIKGAGPFALDRVFKR